VETIDAKQYYKIGQIAEASATTKGLKISGILIPNISPFILPT
jgi:hypothetical protein